MTRDGIGNLSYPDPIVLIVLYSTLGYITLNSLSRGGTENNKMSRDMTFCALLE